MPREAILCRCCKTDIASPTEKDFGEFHTCGNYQFEEKFRRCECGYYSQEEYWVRCLSCGHKQERIGVCERCQKKLDVNVHLHCRTCGNCMNSGMCLCA